MEKCTKCKKKQVYAKGLCKSCYNLKLYYKMKREGRCWRCNQPLDKKGIYCIRCGLIKNSQERQAVARKKTLGLCYLCGKPTDRPETICSSCYGKQKIAIYKWRENNLDRWKEIQREAVRKRKRFYLNKDSPIEFVTRWLSAKT